MSNLLIKNCKQLNKLVKSKALLSGELIGTAVEGCIMNKVNTLLDDITNPLYSFQATKKQEQLTA